MKHLHRTTLLSLGLLATLPTLLSGQGEGGGGAALFDLNLGLSIWTVVVFLALVTVLWKFAWGPILGAVEAREKGIQRALDESAARQAEAARLLEEHKAQLANGRRQVQEIIAEGKSAGERVRRDIEEKAREEAQNIIERAKREIEREKDAAIAELRKESVEIAMAAAAKLMHQKLDPQKDRELVLGYVKDLTRAAGDGGAKA